jgi:tetratricopeptide (TPR) repeat protein
MRRDAQNEEPAPAPFEAPVRWWASAVTWVSLVAVLALAAGIYIAWPRISHCYGTWNASRRAARAADFLEKKDFRSALITAQNALRADPNNHQATLVVAETLESVGALRGAMAWRRRLDVLKPGDAENHLAWARLALNTQDAATAAQALANLKPADQDGESYHDIAASIAAARGESDKAMQHLSEASRLQPENDSYRLRLAALQLKSSKPTEREEAVKALEKLRTIPAIGHQATRPLLEDAVNRGDVARALELADALVAEPPAGFNEKLQRLQVLQALRRPEFIPALEQLQKESATDPAQLFALISTMNDRNLSILVNEWIAKLPPELVSVPPVCVAVADSHARSADWTRLKATTETGSWKEIDFLRLAFLSKALERLGDAAGAKAAWEESLSLAKKRPERLEAVARLASERGWRQQAAEAVRELSSTPAPPRWALDELWAEAMREVDTDSLYKASRLLFQSAPNELVTRNNFICLALLTQNEQDESHRLAQELYENSPGIVEVAATWGLSLFKRGQIKEAVKVMSAFQAEELRKPSVALYYGIFLASNGDTTKAREYLDIGQKGSLLPEEKALALRAGELCRAAEENAKTKAAAEGL